MQAPFLDERLPASRGRALCPQEGPELLGFGVHRSRVYSFRVCIGVKAQGVWVCRASGLYWVEDLGVRMQAV